MNGLNKIRTELQNDNLLSLQEIYVDQLHACQNYLVNKGMASIEDAKDIYTDAILILRTNILKQKLRPNSNLRSYLLGICMNLARSKHRERNKCGAKEAEVRSLFYDDVKTDTGEEAEKMISLCKEALDVLEPKGRRILELYYFKKYSMTEIANELGYASSDAAKTAKYRVYKRWIAEANKLRNIYFESI